MESHLNSANQVEIQRFARVSPQAISFSLWKHCSSGELQLPRGSYIPFGDARITLIVVPRAALAEQILSDTSFYQANQTNQTRSEGASDVPPELSSECFLRSYLGWEVLPFDVVSPDREVSAERLATLQLLLSNRRGVVFATPDALMQRVVPPSEYRDAVLTLQSGMTLDRDQLIERLDALGYVRSTLCEAVGEIGVRGAVIDLFSPGELLPVRLELFGDALESIRHFDPTSQRSVSLLEKFEVLPVSEALMTKSHTSRITQSIRNRAQQLDTQPRVFKQIEEAIENGVRWPGIEHLRPLFGPMATIWDYLPEDTRVAVVDEASVALAAEDFENLVHERGTIAEQEGRLYPPLANCYLTANEFELELRSRTALYLDGLDVLTGEAALENSSRDTIEIRGNEHLLATLRASRGRELPFEPLAEEIRTATRRGFQIVIAVGHKPRMRRIAELLSTYDIPAIEFESGFTDWWFEDHARKFGQRDVRPVEVVLLPGSISAGQVNPGALLHLIADSEIFPEVVSRRKTSAARNVRKFLGSLAQFQEGDFIVHVDHGVGVYRGLRAIEVEGHTGDFLILEYAEEAKLFLPVENIARIQKYVGAEGKQPTLSKLGSKTWAKQKAKVHETVAELAGQLVHLYAQREINKGFSYGEIDADDLRFADTFAFEETPDQAKAITDVLADMAKERPMDRLVCGDVGYGKTEVALRAACKAVNRGKQVAILVPTTILADQHFATFRERFADFPVKVGCLSRFATKEDNQKTVQALAEGKVDIVIGTHRLLQRDVVIPQLGLVIIDEEHRFGVAHKEKLKRLRQEVDVLTLTATPIPRTLHMSMVGIRDLSVIETPPTDRHAIRTYVATYENSLVREAILRELGRSGQVFFIYNRVETIAAVTNELRELVPEARIEFAHGQMKDTELESIMHRFVQREIDVLVSTTIVESGLDIPNANTIIVRNADRLGLAELYQLRGRVGRSSRRAFAYLLISDLKQLGPDARKRLEVLQSLDDLGMGFRLALQDMEIRGAGNLLGRDQSGHISLVGFELYARILKEAVQELRARGADAIPGEGMDVEVPVDPEVNIGFPAHIPSFYIPDVAERLLLYQRLVELRDEGEGFELGEEIEDRFGAPPREVKSLLDLMVFRVALKRAGIVTASFRNDLLSVGFHPKRQPAPEIVVKAVGRSGGTLRVSPTGTVSIRVEQETVTSPADLIEPLHSLLQQLAGL